MTCVKKFDGLCYIGSKSIVGVQFGCAPSLHLKGFYILRLQTMYFWSLFLEQCYTAWESELCYLREALPVEPILSINF